MTEISRPWGGTVTGDAGPYTDDHWSDMFRILFTQDRATQCVINTWRGELAVTGTASPVSVAAGGALVDGKFYDSDAVETVVIPTPSGSTRIDRIVLRKDFSAQTVRITRIAGTEGAGAPAITQTDGTTWDVKLAQCSITTGGVITVTDERVFSVSPLGGLPGNVVFYTTDSSVPAGFSEYTSARGRMVVGRPSGGTDEGTVGTALTNLQNKTHTHSFSGTTSTGATGAVAGLAPSAALPSHTHTYSGTTGTSALSNFLAYIQLLAIQKD
jgi:hypothetical protein